ncbi:hypothetical protein [Sandaracinus amylolyticus]|uniref:hypothetical protein n=1 Tax=Sandaracinus amylolyticus TaxID=927083 RepID=UPI001F41337C|nr:hypothetical protein [Sandaracinus amylolyticus]UJR85838.1 Hypothetical protein I5071_79180 [Sandaracinus amylolyticus]
MSDPKKKRHEPELDDSVERPSPDSGRDDEPRTHVRGEDDVEHGPSIDVGGPEGIERGVGIESEEGR